MAVPLLSDIINALVAAGGTQEQILAVVRAAEAPEIAKREERREKARLKKRRQRGADGPQMSLGTERDSGGQTGTQGDTPETEVSPTPPSRTQPLQKDPLKGVQKGSAKTPVEELGAVLDAERARAVVEHRQRLRKPLTARAAKLLVGDFRRFPDPNAAADEMIRRGWLTIDSTWDGLKSAGRTNGNGNGRSHDRDATWPERLLYARNHQRWASRWGPMPGSDGCEVPPDLLAPTDGHGWELWREQ